MRDYIDTEPGSAGRSGTRSSIKLVVLGATVGTGLEIARLAIEHGHSVTALGRSPDRLKRFRDRITVKQGDLLNPPSLNGLLKVTMRLYPGSVRGCLYRNLTRTFYSNSLSR